MGIGMALVTCSECAREVSDRAVACPFCGNPDIRQALKMPAPESAAKASASSTASTSKADQIKASEALKSLEQPRKVGVLLVVGIVIAPWFFVWLLLRKGYSTQAQILGLCWLVLFCIWFANTRQRVDDKESNPSTPAQQVASPPNVNSPKSFPDKPKLDSVDYAYTICRIVDSTGQSSEPCEVSSPYINIHAAVGAGEAQSICAALVDAARKNGAKFESFWRIRVISPYSGGSPLATCSLPN